MTKDLRAAGTLSDGEPSGDYGPSPSLDDVVAHHTHPFTPEQVKAAAQAGEAKRQRHVVTGATYYQIAAERRAEYREHLSHLPPADDGLLSAWASRMAAKFGGSRVKVHFQALGWAAAFLVQRYGEEVSHWPAALTDADKLRMQQMEITGGAELGNIQPLQLKNGVLQLPGGTVLYGLDDTAEG